MDLEARTKEFLAAIGTGNESSVLALLSPASQVELNGRSMAAETVVRKFLPAVGALQVALGVEELAVKRNVVFAQLVAKDPGGMVMARGVAVFSWDQKGLLTHLRVDASRN